MPNNKITPNATVLIKEGDQKGKQGTVTLIAQINGLKRYYVERPDKIVKWYTYHQLKVL